MIEGRGWVDGRVGVRAGCCSSARVRFACWGEGGRGREYGTAASCMRVPLGGLLNRRWVVGWVEEAGGAWRRRTYEKRR